MTFLADHICLLHFYGAIKVLGVECFPEYPEETQLYRQLLELASFIEGCEIRDVSFVWEIE